MTQQSDGLTKAPGRLHSYRLGHRQTAPTVRFEPVRAWHFRRICANQGDVEVFQAHAERLAEFGCGRYSFTALDENAGPMAIGGIMDNGRTWFLLDTRASMRQALVITRFVRKVLEDYARDHFGAKITATVDESYPERVRWAERLGFSHSGDNSIWAWKPS